MGSLVLDGKGLSIKIESELKERVSKIVEKTGITPILATIIVGEDPASVTYVRMKGNACKRVGIEPLKVELPEETTTEELLAEINKLNADDRVCGILLQHPVPKQIDEQKCFNTISVEKDVDGVNVASFGAVTMGLDAYRSATPCGIIRLLKEYNIEMRGKRAVVIGRSPILGKPVAMLLLNEDATVTICHSKTKNLPEIVKTADILVAAVGRPEFVKAEWIQDGVVLVDAGYNKGNIGDIDLINCAPKSSAYTPVPGGVGPMTIAMLMSQTVDSAEKKYLK
ncbi:MAG TPA: tetrahydrofolate dehydrogenase/cyclohydrolase catalytic domain-containing protein [Clostridia bacterium]|jgi:methylenetetrahydrofolate dehydrogenase (NADP+)/methenyltetrahydrofolate cyclohydrolase|nr:tetrahydrofolate dehydrogenase/cyclohydrolase catalytic domain-containing protein [Clostridia bacterium]